MKTSRRIILYFVNDPHYFISHRLPIASAAIEKGYEVHVASVPGSAARHIQELGFTFHEIPLARGGINPVAELFSIVVFWRLLKRLRPDVIHLVTLKPVLYGGLASRFTPVKSVVAAVAGLGSVFVASDFKYRVIRALVTRMFVFALGKKNLRAIFQNPDDRDVLVSLGAISPEKCVLIRGSGVQLSDYGVAPEPSGRLVVTFAGRLLRDKGVEEFVRAADALKLQGVHAVFQIVGDIDVGNPSSLTSNEVDELKRDGVVLLLGYRRDISSIFSSSNIVVLPSYREGLPKVLIEAAACGRATVTTDVPGCRDAIVPGETGLLVPVRDHAALAEAINQLIKDPELRLRMGRRGRKLAENEFTIQQVVQKHLAIYEELERGAGAS